jgi:hypothetical protein
LGETTRLEKLNGLDFSKKDLQAHCWNSGAILKVVLTRYNKKQPELTRRAPKAVAEREDARWENRPTRLNGMGCGETSASAGEEQHFRVDVRRPLSNPPSFPLGEQPALAILRVFGPSSSDSLHEVVFMDIQSGHSCRTIREASTFFIYSLHTSVEIQSWWGFKLVLLDSTSTPVLSLYRSQLAIEAQL